MEGIPNKTAVFSFYNTPSGLFKWWDEFPDEITQKLNKQGIDHICFYRSFTEHSIYNNSEQNIVESTNSDWLSQVKEMASKYEKVIFHTHSFYPPLKIFLLTLGKREYHWVITEHRLGSTRASKLKKYVRIFLRQLKLMPKQVICVSNAVKIRNESLYGANVTTIHNGIRLKINTNTKVKKQPETAIYVGRLDPKKGIVNLVQAYNLIINHYKKTELKLIVVGGGNVLTDLKKYVKDKALESHVTFMGYQPDPTPFYQQADFNVIPTIIKEACPLVSLEARNLGLPILYTNSGGLPETVGLAGKPLRGTSPQEIATSIIEFCDNEEEYYQLLDNVKTDLDYFTMTRMTDEYVEFYRTLLS